MSEHVETELRDGVLVITLNKQKKLNAWDKPMRDVLTRLFHDTASDDKVRAIVLTGAGDRAFCAGQDLAETRDFDGDKSDLWIEEWRQLYGAIRDYPKPVVNALNGLSAGSAFQVSLLCDIRVGHPETSMGQPEINSGIVSVTGFWIIRETMGLSRATELVLSGRMMPADECQRIGILHHVVARDQVLDKAMAVALELAGKARLALKLTKARIRDATRAGFEEAMEAARILHHESYSAGEPQKAMAAFLNRGK